MSNNLSKIVDVDISITTPVVDGTSFDYILIVGNAPKVSPAKAPAPIGVYSDLKEVNDAGWVSTGGNSVDPVGVAARIAFSQSPRPDKVFIAVQQKKDDGSGELEPIEDTLNRALGMSGWYIICPAGIETDKLEDIAKWTEAQNKMFVFTSLEKDVSFESKNYYRTAWIFGRENGAQLVDDVPADNYYMHVAWACTTLNYAPGSETWAFKSLSVVNPANLTSTEEAEIDTAGGNYYTTVASKNITLQGKVMAGEWIDTIRFRDWLQNDMQIRIYNLFVTNPKIPYTDNGISLVQNQMIASLRAGQRAGGVCETEYDENGDEVKGFTVTVPKASSLTESQRASRKLTGCKFSARLAGAIHMVEIKGNLVY